MPCIQADSMASAPSLLHCFQSSVLIQTAPPLFPSSPGLSSVTAAHWHDIPPLAFTVRASNGHLAVIKGVTWYLKPSESPGFETEQSQRPRGEGGPGLPTVAVWKCGARKTGVKQRKAARQVASLPLRLQSLWKMLILGGSKWRLALI